MNVRSISKVSVSCCLCFFFFLSRYASSDIMLFKRFTFFVSSPFTFFLCYLDDNLALPQLGQGPTFLFPSAPGSPKKKKC